MKAATKRSALLDAAHWHAHLCAAPDCPDTQRQWQHWLQSDALHPWAWQRLEQLQAELLTLPGPLARRALTPEPALPGRRTVLKGLMLGAGVCGVAWTGYRQTPLWMADQRTATGEQRVLNLADGSRLTLDTASAVDIRYDADQRLIILRSGEILVETAKDPRPLTVRSAHGEMRALGTRFTVRLHPGHTELSVLEHAVAVRNGATGAPLRVEAGMRLDFDAGPLGATMAADPNAGEWRHGRLVIDNWRLDRTLAELQRYRPGFIQCADAIAGLRVSGAFPLGDSDRALAMLARSLQLDIRTRTRFWVHLVARS